MKISQIIGMVSGLGVAGLGAIAWVSNPSAVRYETYAGKQIAIYLKENVCTNSGDLLPIELGTMPKSILENYCQTLVDASQPQLGKLIVDQTSQQNYVFFSIYQTRLDLPDPFPEYSFETVGIFNHFYTYRAEKR